MSVSLSRRRLLRGQLDSRPHLDPPWSGSDFNDCCSRCDACIKACPEQVLRRGDGGFPQMDFSQNGCSLCQACVQACPEPVFDLSRQAFDWRAQINTACLVNQGIHCQSCDDACEPRAIRFRPRLGQPPSPELDTTACTGCGACLASCPADAISLETPHG
ncbi:ferredoxin-type protein NapF [Halopseudomonas salegens]|uniref:Ferredoxin-type protein NapF n=1 Tax=Halopseudomonas salegens TaxID=1434072 RepID=A0A1H2H971_9GAMM|nr:ferredoxin-type protein NapF [Halopseudomonas salegens]SDU28354.1 ferredoxin-type protein NapF [Halopseudomonas salegens]